MSEVARFYRIDANTLRRWRRDYQRAPESAFPGPGRRAREKGIAELRRQIERHTQEIDYLMQRIQSAEAQLMSKSNSDSNDLAMEVGN